MPARRERSVHFYFGLLVDPIDLQTLRISGHRCVAAWSLVSVCARPHGSQPHEPEGLTLRGTNDDSNLVRLQIPGAPAADVARSLGDRPAGLARRDQPSHLNKSRPHAL